MKKNSLIENLAKDILAFHRNLDSTADEARVWVKNREAEYPYTVGQYRVVDAYLDSIDRGDVNIIFTETLLPEQTSVDFYVNEIIPVLRDTNVNAFALSDEVTKFEGINTFIKVINETEYKYKGRMNNTIYFETAQSNPLYVDISKANFKCGLGRESCRGICVACPHYIIDYKSLKAFALSPNTPK